MGDFLRAHWRTLAWAMALAVLVLLAWEPGLRGGFQYDDLPNLLNDPATRGGDALLARLGEGIRPLTRLSHVLDFLLWGEHAAGWLLGNLLLHMMAVAGVFLLAREYLGSPRAGLLAAAFFALQPAHAMTVAYATGRAAGLMATLLVAALWAHDRIQRSGAPRAQRSGVPGVQQSGAPSDLQSDAASVERPDALHAQQPGPLRALLPGAPHTLRSSVLRAAWQALALSCFALACLAKETALCFPLLLLLWEAGRAAPVDRPIMLRRIAPYFAVAAAAALVIAANARYQTLLHYSVTLRPPMASLSHNLAALPETLSLLVRPWHLSVVHPPAQPGGMMALWLMVAWALWRRRSWMLLGILWPVAVLSPSHSLIAKADAISESGLYLAWLGPSFALAMVMDRWLRRPGPWRLTSTVLLLLALAGASHWRAQIWSDPVRLWQEASYRAPGAARVWNNLGVAYMARQQDAQARAAFDQALRLDPRNVRALSNRQILDLVN